ncbi:MAG: hypothetical protein R2856_16685 [Caldilineaceae bacterium]
MSEVHKAVFSIFALILSAVFVVACQAQSAMPTASTTAPLVEEDCETPPDVEVCAPGELDSAAAPLLLWRWPEACRLPVMFLHRHLSAKWQRFLYWSHPQVTRLGVRRRCGGRHGMAQQATVSA